MLNRSIFTKQFIIFLVSFLLINFIYLHYFQKGNKRIVERSDDEVLSLLSKIKDAKLKAERIQKRLDQRNELLKKLTEGKLNSEQKKIQEIVKQETTKKKSILDFDFETTYYSKPRDMDKYPSEPPKFPDNPKEEVKQKILQDSIKKFSLTFLTFIRNENDFIDAQNLVDSIFKLDSNSKIIIANSHPKKKFTVKTGQAIEFIEFTATETLGKMIKKLLKSSKTELGLLLKPNSLVNQNTVLDRIFGAFTYTDAVIVSGSNRDIDTGELYLPCYRIFLQRWTYQIEYGYSGTLYYKNEPPVAICQRTELPMTFKLSELKENHYFDELLTDDDLVLEEYYIKMALHIKSVVTPHAMFHVKRNRPKSINQDKFIEKWMPLAKKYKFDNIIGYQGNENRIMLCREDWSLAFHHVYFMEQFLYTPTCNCNFNKFLTNFF